MPTTSPTTDIGRLVEQYERIVFALRCVKNERFSKTINILTARYRAKTHVR